MNTQYTYITVNKLATSTMSQAKAVSVICSTSLEACWEIVRPVMNSCHIDGLLPGETWTWPPEIVFSAMLYTVSWKLHCFGLLCLQHSSTNANNFFADNRVILLSTVCKYYFTPSHFVSETRYTAWLKRHNFWGLCFPRYWRDISGIGGIANHCLIAYCISNVSAKNI